MDDEIFRLQTLTPATANRVNPLTRYAKLYLDRKLSLDIISS